MNRYPSGRAVRLDRRTVTAILIATFGCAVVALLFMSIFGTTESGVLGFICAGLAALVSYKIGIRAVLATALLMLIPPGVMGETSFVLAMLGLSGLLVIALTFKPDRASTFSQGALIGLGILAPGVGMAVTGSPTLVLMFGFASIISILAVTRRAFITAVLDGLTWLLGIFAASWILTYVVGGFWQAPSGILAFETRSLELRLPLTFTTGGPPIIPDSRRFAPFTGEPGLAGFYLVPLFARVFAKDTVNSTRVATATVVAAVAVFSGSLATIALITGAAVVVCIVLLFRSRHAFIALVLSAVALVAGPQIVASSLAEKSAIASTSVTDRGIADVGGASLASLGNINLLVTLTNTPILAASLIAGLLLLAFVAWRSLAGLGAWIVFAGIVTLAQPSQWHAGAWMLAAFAFALTAPTKDRQPAPSEADRTQQRDVAVPR